MKTCLTAAAAAALLALPAFAQDAADPTPPGELSIGNLRAEYLDRDGPGVDGDGVLFGGHFLVRLRQSDGGWSLQGDARFGALDDTSVRSGAAHLYHWGERHALGVVAGMADREGAEPVWAYGLEGARFFDRATLSGQASYLEQKDGSEDAVAADLAVKLYATDNFAFDLGVGSVDFEGSRSRADVIGAGVEFKLGPPVSLFGRVESSDELGDTVGIGLRFGGGSLKERDRQGPVMGRTAAERLGF